MHIGFYMDATHLDKWDWQAVISGQVALSGTDGSLLRVAHELAGFPSCNVTLLTTWGGTTPSATPACQVVVDHLTDAVRYAHTHQLDVLVFNNVECDEVIAGVKQAERLAQPCVVWCQNGPSRAMASFYLDKTVIRRVVCVTHVHADTYRDKRIFEKIAVIHNPIDARYFSATPTREDTQTVCYVGAMTPDKGFHHLAKAWPQVRAVFPEARLIVVGSARLYDRSIELGPLGLARNDYEQTHLVPHLGTSRRKAEKQLGISFRGLLPPDQISAVLQHALIGVVNPNTQRSLETFCVTAVEMQATATAVVGARRKGLRETVRHGETGLLIRSPRQLAPTLCRLLNKPAQTRRMGKRGREWVSQTFETTRIAKRWQRLLGNVIRGAPASPPPFSLSRATPKTIVREAIRRLRLFATRGK